MSTEALLRVRSFISGSGMNVPDRVVPNTHFASYLETSDEWIRERTGIKERRWTDDPSLTASELALPAAEQALKKAGLTASDIDGIVFATVTPDAVFPSCACLLQQKLGIGPCLAFDLNAVCSGFVYALTVADSFIHRGICKNVLVVGSELYSKIVNPNDRSTCVLFGDGAGAVVLSAHAQTLETTSKNSKTTRGIYLSELHADGNYKTILSCAPDGGTAKDAVQVTPPADDRNYILMAGKEVFKLAVRGIAEVSSNVLRRTGFTVSDVDLFVVHQANQRIIQSVAKQLDIPDQKIPMNVERYGNTSAASIPLLLAELEAEGRLKPGMLVLLSAFGGGVTWGATLLRW